MRKQGQRMSKGFYRHLPGKILIAVRVRAVANATTDYHYYCHADGCMKPQTIRLARRKSRDALPMPNDKFLEAK
jgi:hypothetical protein